MASGGLLGALVPFVCTADATVGRATPLDDACDRDEAVDDWLRLAFGDVLLLVVAVHEELGVADG